ncbi:MAG: alpha/beta fold hydrolase [Alphaproteobacteria bacterium]|nr:alpha/beta fold hydrolase [Alphaproteobacteria bacterium]
MDRRQVLIGGAAGAAAAATGVNAAVSGGNAGLATFVLVHGTWHGGWVWRDVRQRLEAAGHRVLTPTCTGCGERNHLIVPDVGLDTHIDDIVNVLRFEELENVILVGHSFSGMTITGVADRERDRIRRIVFFDALTPHEGVMTCVPKDPETGAFPEWWQKREAKFIDGYQMVFWDEYPVEMLVPKTDEANVARLRKLLTTHPAKQWTDELVLTNGGWDGLRPAYIHCVGQEYRLSSPRMVGPATTDPQWTYLPIDAPRDAMLTHPELSAQKLLELAA